MLGAHSILVENKMAALHLKREIRAKMLGMKVFLFKRSKNDEKFVDDVFKEFSVLMETVFEKHDGLLAHVECHEIVDIWPMTRRCLQKLHESILRRLRSTPTSSSRIAVHLPVRYRKKFLTLYGNASLVITVLGTL